MKSTQNGSLLIVDSVTRRFGGLVAVGDVSVEILPGQLVGLIGPNGAGKSTLFNLISGFMPVSEGDIFFNGRKTTGLRSFEIARLGIGRTFQNLRIFPNMTVFDNVSIGAIGTIGHSLRRTLFHLGTHSGDRQISESTWNILERVKLAEVAGELAANLSYGRRKYLEIARALALRPKLLMLDEPAAGLNEAETEELAGFIQYLHGTGMTILIVEHDMSLIMGICKRVVVLASGRKIADGTPEVVARDSTVLEAYLGAD